MEYHKINGLYKRWRKDLHTPDMLPKGAKYNDVILGEFSCPEFEYLFEVQWVWSEKLDGTNMRIIVPNDSSRIKLRGKTDDTSIPTQLYDWFLDWLEINEKKLRLKFSDGAILYLEGVGKGIQNGTLFGKQHLKLFDVYVGGYWLERIMVDAIGKELNLDTPEYWYGTIQEAINEVKSLPTSSFGDFIIEGYVGQPKVRLYDAQGNRIVTKIKVRDFVK